MKTGWFKDKGLWYYLKPDDGVMATGLLDVDGTRYYLNSSGAMETGWKQLNGNWYYFQVNGSLLRNGTTPDGYKVNQDGIWSLNPDKVEVQGSQEEPKKDSDKPVEKEKHSAEVNEKDEAAETKPILKADKE